MRRLKGKLTVSQFKIQIFNPNSAILMNKKIKNLVHNQVIIIQLNRNRKISMFHQRLLKILLQFWKTKTIRLKLTLILFILYKIRNRMLEFILKKQIFKSIFSVRSWIKFISYSIIIASIRK